MHLGHEDVAVRRGPGSAADVRARSRSASQRARAAAVARRRSAASRCRRRSTRKPSPIGRGSAAGVISRRVPGTSACQSPKAARSLRSGASSARTAPVARRRMVTARTRWGPLARCARVCPYRQDQSVATITSEALMIAIAFLPASRPRSATASLVIEAKILAPPTSRTTCDVVAPLCTSKTVPGSWCARGYLHGLPFETPLYAARRLTRTGARPTGRLRQRHVAHVVGESERRGQPRRFDAEEIDQPRDPVRRNALDDKVARGLALAVIFGGCRRRRAEARRRAASASSGGCRRRRMPRGPGRPRNRAPRPIRRPGPNSVRPSSIGVVCVPIPPAPGPDR